MMVWNYHDEDLAGQPERVQVVMEGVSAKKVTLTQYVVDKHHSNSYEVWKQMGSPQQPTTEQITQLEKAGQLEQTSVEKNVVVQDGKLTVPITIERQGVVLLKVDW